MTPAPMLLAVSGGGDSMALLHREIEAGADVAVCHVDHGVRPGSRRDAAWVRACCEALGVPCVVRRVRPAGPSEAALRAARYAALAEVARRLRRPRVATGHTLDDQAETVMLRILRGARLKGLGGIPPERPLGPGITLVRPLLRERRADLRAWLRARGVAWIDDPTNADPAACARNRLRAAGLPVDPEVLARVADAAAGAWRLLADRGAHAADVPTLRALPAATRRVALERVAGGALLLPQLLALEHLVASPRGAGAVHLPAGRRVVRRYDRLTLDAQEPLPIGEIVLSFNAAARFGGRPPARDAWEAWFDADGLRYPLTVRGWRPGDRIRPFGGAGRRKVQDVLVDGKVPRAERRGRPLVVDGDEVIWIPGVARGALAPVGEGTREILRMRWEPHGQRG